MTIAPPHLREASTSDRLGSVLVILPTYNEAANVASLVPLLLASAVHADVLVVDDGSPDGTADVAENLGIRHRGRVHVLRRRAKQGLGPAYRAAFQWALARHYDVIVQMDADGSHPVNVLPAMLEGIERGSDLVIGSRYVEGGGTADWPVARRMLSRFGNSYARLLLGLPVRDVTGGYRCWERHALELISSLEPLADGYGFLVEMATAAHRLGLHIDEVPIIFKNRELGTSKMSLRIGLEAMRLVLRLRRAPDAAGQEVAGLAATPL